MRGNTIYGFYDSQDAKFGVVAKPTAEEILQARYAFENDIDTQSPPESVMEQLQHGRNPWDVSAASHENLVRECAQHMIRKGYA